MIRFALAAFAALALALPVAAQPAPAVLVYMPRLRVAVYPVCPGPNCPVVAPVVVVPSPVVVVNPALSLPYPLRAVYLRPGPTPVYFQIAPPRHR